MKMRSSAYHFLVILTLTFYICFTIGLKWVTEPLQVFKCKGQTANLNWEYMVEPGEEITHLQWIFNRTELIAYSSQNQDFNVEPKFQGRVSQSGKAGILLHNISYKDSGSYTLYPLIRWEERPNIETVQLNVIDEAMEPDCSCKRFLVLPEERNGQAYRITVGSCKFEINSSACCPVGLVYQYCVNDQSTLCVPISNHNNQDTNGYKELITSLHNRFTILICAFVMLIVVLCVIFVVIGVLKIHHWKSKNLGRNLENSDALKDLKESQPLQVQDDIHEV